MLAVVPGHAMFEGELWENACVKAMKEIGTDDLEAKEVGERASKIFNEAWFSSGINEKLRRFNEATSNADAMWRQTEGLYDSLHLLLESMIIQSWTAFEVLVDHLWRAAIAKKPDLLNSIPSNARRSIGFRSRSKIRFSYKETFRTDKRWIETILESHAIDSLALIRCVLVHSSGTIDDWFMRDSKDISEVESFRAIGVGNKIALTGEMTRSLIDPVTVIGFELLQAVDDWLWFNL
jgi:hypothetical protein